MQEYDGLKTEEHKAETAQFSSGKGEINTGILKSCNVAIDIVL